MTVKSPTPFLALFLLAFCCPDSFAGKPNSHSLGYYDSLEAVNCGDYSVMGDAGVFANIREYVEEGGVIQRSQIHLIAKDDFYRDDDPGGRHVTSKARFNDHVFFDEAGQPLWEPVAILGSIHISGTGVLILDLGVLDIDPDDWEFIFSEDRFGDWSPADFEALCAHFG